jgi:hypothetical protein
MKTVQTTTKALMRSSRTRGKLHLDSGTDALFAPRTKQSLIQWPTDQQIQEVSKRLARISQKGIRVEADGDYFNSGDLAYQLQEIIRATAELFKKSQRIKR